jgi:hypothetical protein
MLLIRTGGFRDEMLAFKLKAAVPVIREATAGIPSAGRRNPVNQSEGRNFSQLRGNTSQHDSRRNRPTKTSVLGARRDEASGSRVASRRAGTAPTALRREINASKHTERAADQVLAEGLDNCQEAGTCAVCSRTREPPNEGAESGGPRRSGRADIRGRGDGE